MWKTLTMGPVNSMAVGLLAAALAVGAACDEGGDGTGASTPPATDETPTDEGIPVADQNSETPGESPVTEDPPVQVTASCEPLPAPGPDAIEVGPEMADELPGIVAAAPSGATILLRDGTYRMSQSAEGQRRIQINTPGLTLRSASGRADAVVLDGEYITSEMVTISASDTTLADFTLTRAIDHLLHISPGDGGTVTGVRLLGMRFVDAGEQFIKMNPNGARTAFVDDGEVACSVFQLTDEGRPRVERQPGGCYTGGIDAHAARGWHVHHNHFQDIYCAGEGLAEHAVHFWSASRDTLVENNVIVNCARGIGFGLVDSGDSREYADDPYPGVGYVGHYDGMIRNNVVFADIDYYDTGIELAQAHGVRVYHNTVVSEGGRLFFSSIDSRFPNTDADIRNNLTRRITRRNGASTQLDANLEDTPMSYFVAADAGDFHLTDEASAAIDSGVPVDDAGLDIDGQPRTRGEAPDLGADER